jgi:hypothetical protein
MLSRGLPLPRVERSMVILTGGPDGTQVHV